MQLLNMKSICGGIKGVRAILLTMDVSTPEKHKNAVSILDRYVRLMLAQFHMCVYTMGQVTNWEYLEQVRLLSKEEIKTMQVTYIYTCCEYQSMHTFLP